MTPIYHYYYLLYILYFEAIILSGCEETKN